MEHENAPGGEKQGNCERDLWIYGPSRPGQARRQVCPGIGPTQKGGAATASCPGTPRPGRQALAFIGCRCRGLWR